MVQKLILRHGVSAAVAMFLLMMPVWWAFDPSRIVTFQKFEQVGPVVAGEMVPIKIIGYRHQACPLTATIFFQDETGRRAKIKDEFFDAAGPVGPFEYIMVSPLPTWVKPGAGAFTMILSYKCNPWQAMVEPKVVQTVVPVQISETK